MRNQKTIFSPIVLLANGIQNLIHFKDKYIKSKDIYLYRHTHTEYMQRTECNIRVLQNSYVEILTSKVILAGEAFGRLLDHEGALMNRISALIKGTPWNYLSLSLHHTRIQEVISLQPRKRSSPETQPSCRHSTLRLGKLTQSREL